MRYADKLKDARWQARRLEVFTRAKWCCERCGTNAMGGGVELAVHHMLYRKGCEPWEYADAELLCVCAPCHRELEAHKTDFEETLLRLPPDARQWITRAIGRIGQQPGALEENFQGWCAMGGRLQLTANF